MESTAVSFFVDDLKMARLLSNADRTIEMPNGFKMIIKVRNGVPPLQLDVRVKEQMKLAMVKRYTAPNKAMDLTKFHADPDLQDVFCGLFRPPIMLAVIDIIAENIPDLEALNLDNNKIQSLDHFKCLATKLPNLKILYMANNKVCNVWHVWTERHSTKHFLFLRRLDHRPHWNHWKTPTLSIWYWKEIQYGSVSVTKPFISGINFVNLSHHCPFY